MASTPHLPSAILVHEYVTGGGWPEPELPRALAAEALAILQALLADARAWGRFPVVTTRDARLDGVGLPADRVVELDHRVYRTELAALAAECGAAIVVAPESGGALEDVTRLLAGAGVAVLGSAPEAVAVAADKWVCHRRFVGAGLPTPQTLRVAPAGAAAAAERLGYPVVVKPLDGAGCAGVCLAADRPALEGALALPALRREPAVLVQRYAGGMAGSVSLLVAGGRSVAVSLNEQRLCPGAPFTYDGGVASVGHPRRAEAEDLAREAVALVPGLQGYVGVDVVLGRDDCKLIEINPRPTTSCVGLCRVAGLNLVAAIWDACRHGVLPAPGRRAPSFAFEAGCPDGA